MMELSGNEISVSGNAVEFNSSVLNTSRKSYSSLTDLNHEALFTDEYAARVAEVNQKKLDSYNKIASEVFIKEISGNEALYDNVKEMMFSGKEPRILVRTKEPKQNGAVTFIGVCLILALFLTAMLVMIRPKTGRS